MDEQFRSMKPRRWIWVLLAVALLGIAAAFYIRLFSAPDTDAPEGRFTVARNHTIADIIERLAEGGYVRSPLVFRAVLDGREVELGGYKVSKAMNVFEVANVLTREPYMKWVTIKEGLRKEEIADVIGDTLGWAAEQRSVFVRTDTNTKPEYREGVYFPDTYLIPIDEPTGDVAGRLLRNFNTRFAPYAKEAAERNIRWDTVVKIASLIQREAAGKHDMALISGVIWNRLNIDMRLDIDATVQYARGDKGKGWWAPITLADKEINSPYNTFMYKGLPPTPIANPGEDAIRAALFPEKTDCLYYLHAPDRKIYCAKTFEEHKKNIEKYLK